MTRHRATATSCEHPKAAWVGIEEPHPLDGSPVLVAIICRDCNKILEEDEVDA